MSPSVNVVAIDGPAGAGKSTIALELARVLNLPYLDTGAMYRGITCAVLRKGIDPSDESSVAQLALSTVLDISDNGLFVDGLDATLDIRGESVTRAVSSVAANSEVRSQLRELQRKWVTERGGGVVEGRDIATVVFPDARLKIYLTASPLVRAQRRVAQIGGDVEQIAQDIAERDHRDSTRIDSPLRESESALVVDTSNRTIEDVVNQIVVAFHG
ncbi:MAG: cytidylate kinase [Acidimicrobiia bacterium BACL6 MAG-121220-bin61]|jgi:CMP/dCMP kinase|nr:MAG: cytidylate kinase [Acidimicrobiia bacterium BACL6 MAG-120910-bin40]KRO62844.1 MAG: cytidylate kinase [Acidimicrobiia bacterium BACL6 MAG-121220-bin61]